MQAPNKHQEKGDFDNVIKQNAQMWDQIALRYAKLTDRRIAPLYLELINMVKVEDCDKIIEVGCGGSYLIPHVLSRKKPSAELHISDISTQMLGFTKQKIDRFIANPLSNIYDNNEVPKPFDQKKEFYEKFNLTVSCSNGQDLVEHKSNYFDCYIANLVIFLVPDPVQMAKEAFRVLKKGGKAIFSVWGRKENSPVYNIAISHLKKIGIDVPESQLKFQMSNREQQIALLEKAGFKNVVSWYTFVGYQSSTEEEVDKLLGELGTLKKMIQLVKPEEQKKALADIQKEIMDQIKIQKLPLGVEFLIFMGEKD